MATKSETERELSKTQNKLLWESNRRKNTLEAISNLRSWAVFSEIPDMIHHGMGGEIQDQFGFSCTRRALDRGEGRAEE